MQQFLTFCPQAWAAISISNHDIIPLGETALLVQFGNSIDEQVNAQVLQLFGRLKDRKIPGITDIVPAYSSLAVYYDPVVINEVFDDEGHADERKLRENVTASPFLKVAVMVRQAMQDLSAASVTGRRLRIPVCYAEAFAPDLAEAAASCGMDQQSFIALHASVSYRVFMIGFLPGFPYMGPVPERIALPRKNNPRAVVPAGSVGIAGRQTGIYPMASPGGWQLIGRTPVSIFNKDLDEPVLFQPGDRVTFYPITAYEFADLEGGHF